MAQKEGKEQKKKMHKQEITGVLSLKDVAEIKLDLGIRIGVFRNCQLLNSEVFMLDKGQTELDYRLAFEHPYGKAIGVRLIAGPASVPVEQLRAVEHYQEHIPARFFVRGVSAKLDLSITDRLYRHWLIYCRTYTLRGRVVCRRIIWDPIRQRFTICDAPVRGAKVTAFDVDRFFWWCRRDEVGSDFTDLDGNFEITFRFCCWRWRPWLFDDWLLDPDLVRRIDELLHQVPNSGPIPRPDPVLDFSVFERLISSTNVARAGVARPGFEPVLSSNNLAELGEALVDRLPEAADLRELHVWPWHRRRDCRPDIVFEVTQDCGEGEQTVYSESCAQTRWNIDTLLDGVVLVANDNACCGPFCCADPPDDDCLVFHGVGCGGYPFDQIEQDPTDPLVGYAFPGAQDLAFGGSLRLLGVFGDGSEVDFYKLQSRRISPAPTAWADVPANQITPFSRGYWTGVVPPVQWETVDLQVVDGENVLKTVNRYREENPGLPAVDPIHNDWLAIWKTATGVVDGVPLLPDGVYELRVVGYRYNEAADSLVDQKIMALCPGLGEEVDPADHATFYIRLDNRISAVIVGSVHLNTTEPDCDFPNICAVVKNEGESDEECVGACGIVRVQAGDTLTIHFKASDADGHLAAYEMTAHWAESDVFNVLSVGDIEPDPDELYGPTYAHTFLLDQGAHRAALPAADPEQERPFWYGGNFQVVVTVDDPVPASPHRAFETCCAHLLRLRVWKRTTNGCTGPYYLHVNHCEFSFTVIREDLIGDPAHPSCSEICADDE